MTCKACQDRVKNWKGDDPKCAFLNGAFDGSHGWNCATANALRDIIEDNRDTRIQHRCTEDQHYATLCTGGLDVLPTKDAEGRFNKQPVCIWVSWYKNRGRTEAMWLMFDTTPPRVPTEEECLKIIEHYALPE